MPMFRKKPVEVEAIQFVEGNGLPFEGEAEYRAKDISNSNGRFDIKVHENWHPIYWGDWIVKGVVGEFYPCKQDVFEKTHELINDDDITIELIPVKSSNIKAIGYDGDSAIMHIQFHNGGLYEYKDIEPDDFNNFLNAPSHGKELHQWGIKGSKV